MRGGKCGMPLRLNQAHGRAPSEIANFLKNNNNMCKDILIYQRNKFIFTYLPNEVVQL